MRPTRANAHALYFSPTGKGWRFSVPHPKFSRSKRFAADLAIRCPTAGSDDLVGTASYQSRFLVESEKPHGRALAEQWDTDPGGLSRSSFWGCPLSRCSRFQAPLQTLVHWPVQFPLRRSPPQPSGASAFRDVRIRNRHASNLRCSPQACQRSTRSSPSCLRLPHRPRQGRRPKLRRSRLVHPPSL